MTAITLAVVLATLQASARAQGVEVLQFAAESVAAGSCGRYKNPLPLCFQRYYDNDSPSGEAGPLSRCGPNDPRCCHPVDQLNREGPSPEFVYKLTLSNEGRKTIRAVEWEYIFVERETQLEVARHQFLSEQIVRPGKRATLVEYSTLPPVTVISVRALSRPESDRFVAQVLIKRVIYEDGSMSRLPLLTTRTSQAK
jgi:hypothetical protein